MQENEKLCVYIIGNALIFCKDHEGTGATILMIISAAVPVMPFIKIWNIGLLRQKKLRM